MEELKEKFIKQFCDDDIDPITGQRVLVIPMKVAVNPIEIFNWFINESNRLEPLVTPKIAETCSWCGGGKGTKGRGKLSVKVIHDGCYEDVLNGGGII